VPTLRPRSPSPSALGTGFVAPLSGLLMLAAAGCAPSAPSTPPPQQAGPVAPESRNTGVQKGEASFYADQFEGRSMANGETFSQNSDSAASKTLPLGSKAQVKNLENGRTAVVTIEDRGPHVAGRVIDVSKQTAKRLGMVEDGTAKVEVKPLGGGGR